MRWNSATRMNKLIGFYDAEARLWFCRGEGKCLQTDARERTAHCADCALRREGESIDALARRLTSGDA